MHDDREIFENALQFDYEKENLLQQDIAFANRRIVYEIARISINSRSCLS